MVELQLISCRVCRVLDIVVIRVGTQEAQDLSKSDVAKRMKVTCALDIIM